MLKSYLKNIIYTEMAANPSKVLITIILDKLDLLGYHRTNKTDVKINLRTSDEKQIKKIIESTIPGLAISMSEPIMSKALGGLSNTYPTYEISLKKKCTIDGNVFDAGISFKIANAYQEGKNGKDSAGTELGNKSLTPTELMLDDKKWMKAKDIQKTALMNISSKYNDNIKQLVEILFNEVILKINNKKPKIDGIINIEDNEKTTIALSDEAMKLIDLINPADVNVIGKNFGEVLGGIYFFQKYSASNVLFPSQSNFPLIDFIVDDVVFVSAKYGAGAAPSTKVLADKILENPKAFAKVDKRLKNILTSIAQNSTLTSYINAAEQMNTMIFQQMDRFGLLGETDRDTQILTNDFLVKKYKQFGGDDEKMTKFLRKEFWQYAASEPDAKNVMDKIASGQKCEGAIIYPLESELVNMMNNDKELLLGLKAITKTIGVKQLYFDFQINKTKRNISFLIKFFETKDFKFALTTSVNNYVNSNICFKMI